MFDYRNKEGQGGWNFQNKGMVSILGYYLKDQDAQF